MERSDYAQAEDTATSQAEERDECSEPDADMSAPDWAQPLDTPEPAPANVLDQAQLELIREGHRIAMMGPMNEEDAEIYKTLGLLVEEVYARRQQTVVLTPKSELWMANRITELEREVAETGENFAAMERVVESLRSDRREAVRMRNAAMGSLGTNHSGGMVDRATHLHMIEEFATRAMAERAELADAMLRTDHNLRRISQLEQQLEIAKTANRGYYEDGVRAGRQSPVQGGD